MLRYLVVLISICVFYNTSYSQADTLRNVLVIDKATNSPIEGVLILKTDGSIVAKSNRSGSILLKSNKSDQQPYLIVYAANYMMDTLYPNTSVVALRLLEKNLEEVIVKNKPINILQKENEYVVDYAFHKDKIVIATSYGSIGNKNKLYLTTIDGQVLHAINIDTEPVELFKSCLDSLYLITPRCFYSLKTDSTIQLDKKYSSAYLEAFKQCQAHINNTLFYKFYNRNFFTSNIYAYNQDSAKFKKLTRVSDSTLVRASLEELALANFYLSMGDYKTAFKYASTRLLCDKSTLKKVNVPVFDQNDTLIIFDFLTNHILCYNQNGNLIKQTPLNFEYKNILRTSVIKDRATNTYYLDTYDDGIWHYLQKIDLSNGTLKEQKIKLEHPYPDDIELYNDNIYFLWYDYTQRDMRQMYVQKT